MLHGNISLPGSIPGAAQGDITSVDKTQPDDSVDPDESERWLTEVCLALCEKNFQTWKSKVPNPESGS